jgi:hypothetical protein
MTTHARIAYTAACVDTASTVDRLKAEGRHDRATGLAVAADIGTSAAFMFSTSDKAFEDATRVLREAIAHAEREETS